MKISDLNFPDNVTVKAFESREALTDALATELQSQLGSALSNKGKAGIAFSGGRTPIPLFEALSEASLDWPKVNTLLVDDRWLEESHKDSNEGLIKRTLLTNKAKDAVFTGFYQAGKTGKESEQAINEAFAHLSDEALDVVILGMGNDGHTASLFPCADNTEAALNSTDDFVAVQPTTAPYERMSMTPKRILNSELLILHSCGEDKLETLAKALADTDVLDMPIRLFLKHPITLYWAP
ncbi:MAG: 6-phosphogluconolactonase [Pontibacterium sp.]